MKVEIESGEVYDLCYDGLYYWKSNGPLNKLLTGKYASQQEALSALSRVESSKSLGKASVEKDASVSSLTKKVELLSWAEKNEIEIPKEHKSVGAIKKFLMGGYEQNAC